jgi:hypothetical protein
MRLNLTPIRSLVEDLTMRDACRITREATPNVGNGTWDEETGTYIPPVVEPELIYEGQCTVYPVSTNATDEESGGTEVSETRYWIGIPFESDVQTNPEDDVEITEVDATEGDITLVGKEFKVTHQEYNTMASTRRIQVRLLVAVP